MIPSGFNALFRVLVVSDRYLQLFLKELLPGVQVKHIFAFFN
jgi:hypothetical protein